MKKSTAIALFTLAFAAALSPAVAFAQPFCAYPAHWVWRGYWNCEYPAPMYYPSSFYPYYGYPFVFFGGFGSRPFFHGGHFVGGFHGGSGHVGGGFHGASGHVGGGFRSGGGGRSGGGHGGHR
jgi:hypothetical protein